MTATLSQARREAAGRLRAAGIDSAALDARLLVMRATGLSRERLVTDPDRELGPHEAAALEALLARRLGREPMAYILGEREFFGLSFAVSPSVLIPRPDTETLVEEALAAADPAAPLRILDIATGSGCILLAVLHHRPAATGIGTDRSAAALAVARRNAEALGLAGRTRFVRTDWAACLAGPFDMILSNPPYITAGEMAALEPEVGAHEPHVALEAGADGLAAYRAIAADLLRLLAPRGRILLEIGRGQATQVAALLDADGLRVTARRPDLAGIDRCLVAERR
ncbi:peptide chain release factor N(5)-glutamine methyltransferase [Geminicoccaceae bacterium 1502E]|nr:peptide chain release factor N(5)-glutamine methyltransferase [Geminicoccaceae bacterium 1502E]